MRNRSSNEDDKTIDSGWAQALRRVPDRVDVTAFWSRAVLLAAFAVWGIVLIRLDYRVGAFAEAFLHRPLLVFHEAGHVIFQIGRASCRERVSVLV